MPGRIPVLQVGELRHGMVNKVAGGPGIRIGQWASEAVLLTAKSVAHSDVPSGCSTYSPPDAPPTWKPGDLGSGPGVALSPPLVTPLADCLLIWS